MEGQKVSLRIRNHIRYVLTEGWVGLQYRLFRDEDSSHVIAALEYRDPIEDTKGGEFWCLPESEFDEILELFSDLKIPKKKEEGEPKKEHDEDENPGDAYVHGYQQGYDEGYDDARKHMQEEDSEGEEWRTPEPPE